MAVSRLFEWRVMDAAHRIAGADDAMPILRGVTEIQQISPKLLIKDGRRIARSTFKEKLPMHRKRLIAGALTLSVAVFAVLQSADAAAARVRVRGTVESLDGDTLKVKSRDGKDVTVALKSGWSVGGVVKADVSDIKPGDFVGIASQPTASGINGAIEVVIFPASMKGTGEGDRPWDSAPNGSMTNATVTNAVASVNGPTLTLTYKGGERKIRIPDGTPVVTLTSAKKADLKPGAGVFITGEQTGETTVSADRIAVGLNGTVPPM